MREWGEEVISRIGKAMFLKELELEVRSGVRNDLPKNPQKDNGRQKRKTP